MNKTTLKQIIGKSLAAVSAIILVGCLVKQAQEKPLVSTTPVHFSSSKSGAVADLLENEPTQLYFQDAKSIVNVKDLNEAQLQAWIDKGNQLRQHITRYLSTSKSGFIGRPVADQRIALVLSENKKMSSYLVWDMNDNQWAKFKELIKKARHGKSLTAPAGATKAPKKKSFIHSSKSMIESDFVPIKDLGDLDKLFPKKSEQSK